MLWEKICGGSFLWQVADITGEAHIRADITAPAVLAAVVIQADTLVRAGSPAEVTIVMAEALIPVITEETAAICPVTVTTTVKTIRIHRGYILFS